MLFIAYSIHILLLLLPAPETNQNTYLIIPYLTYFINSTFSFNFFFDTCHILSDTR